VFTRVPAQGTVQRDVKPSLTTVFLSVPVTLDRFLAEAERAIPQQIMPIKEVVEDAACDKRKGPWVECANAKFEGELTRDGQIGLKLVDGRLHVDVPLKFSVTARGLGWAAYLNESKSGAFTVGLPIETTLAPGYTLDARIQGDLVWSEKTIQLLKGRIALKSVADTRLKALVKPLTDVLRQSLAEQPVREAAERAWRGLHTPIELMRKPGLWLRGAPEKLASGGFAMERGEIVHRIAITTRLAAYHGEKPAPLFAKPLPEPTRLAQTELRTEIRLPVDVSLAETQRALEAAFPKGEKLETRVAAGELTVVEVSAAQLFPARERMGIMLQLDVLSPKRLFGLTGKAFLIGMPAFNASSGQLELTQIGFPSAPPKTPGTNTAAKQPDLVKLGEEPFAGRIARAVKIDVGREVRNLMPRINAMIEQRLEENLTLGGTFESYEIAAIDPGRDSLKVSLDLSGALTLRYGSTLLTPGRMEQTQGDGVKPPEPTVRR
jgi:hypothetical protein